MYLRKSNIWRMFGLKKIIILILSIQVIHVHSDEQSNKDVTKSLTYAKVLLNGLTDYVKFVNDKFVHLDQLPEKEVNDHVKNRALHHVELIQLQNKLYLLENNLTELALLPLDKEEDVSASKTKSVALNKEFDNLNKQLEKLRLCRNLPLLYDTKKVDDLLEKYSSLVAEKTEMYKKLEDKEQTQLVDDCVLAVELGRYRLAAEKFNLVKDDNKVKDIVDRVYSEDGAYFLLKFGNNIKNLKRTYLLYKALYNKLHNDKVRSKNVSWHYFKYLALLKSMKGELLDQPVVDSDLKSKSAELLKAVKGDKVNLGVKLLTNEVVNNGTRTVHFLKRPLTFDYEVVGEVCYQTVVNTHKEHLNDLKDTLNLVFSELSETSEGNALHFGQFVKYLETKLKGSEYESSLQLDLAGVKEKLPNVVRNVLYAEKVCIKQDGPDTYLKQAGDTYTYLEKSYKVYTGPQRAEQEERWQLTHVHGDEYVVKNLLHDYALDVDDTTLHTHGEKTNNHEVVTTNNKQQSNVWKMEVTNDYAYLKNTANNEYLFASLEFTKGDAATNNFNGELSKAYQWNVLDCTNVPLREGPP